MRPLPHPVRAVRETDTVAAARDLLARYAFVAPACVGNRVLDLASKTNEGADVLRVAGAREVVVASPDTQAFLPALGRPGGGLHAVGAETSRLRFDREFDVVISFDTVERLARPDRFVDGCVRACRARGRLILSTPLDSGRASGDRRSGFDRDALAALLRPRVARFTLLGQRRTLIDVFQPLRGLPDRGRCWALAHAPDSAPLFGLLDRLNHAPNRLLAWLSGAGEAMREQIRPLDDPLLEHPMLRPSYDEVIAVCDVA